MQKIKKNISLAAILILALSFSAGFVLAEELEELPITESAPVAENSQENTTFSQELVVPEVNSAAADLDNTPVELSGANQPTLLPDSPFYFVKEMGRGINNFFTFSNEGKAANRLEQATDRLAEVQVMMEKTDANNVKKNQTITKAIKKYESDIDQAEQRMEKISRDSKTYTDLADKAMDKYAAFTKTLSTGEDTALNINKDIVQEIYNTKQKVLNNFSGLIDKTGAPSEKIESILEQQPGSEFKDFRNLEVLKELSERLPANAAEAVLTAQKNISEKLQEKLKKSVENKQGENFANYVMNIKGNGVQHMAILDELGKNSDLPDEIINGFRAAKDAVAINFSKEMMNHPASNQMIEDIASGDIDKLRVLENMADALPDYASIKDELNNVRQKALDRAGEKMNSIQSLDDKINFLLKDGVPDAKSFAILDEIQTKFSPDQQEQMKQVRNQAFQIFSDVIDKDANAEKLMSRLASDDPKDLELISVIKEKLPVNMMPKFDKLMKNQMDKIGERLMNENDITRMIDLRARLEESPKAMEMINAANPQLMDKIAQNQMAKVEKVFDNISDPSQVVDSANRYTEFLNTYPSLAENMQKNNPEMVNRLAEKQAAKISQGLKEITDPQKMDEIMGKMDSAGFDKFKEQVPEKVKNEIKSTMVEKQKEVRKNQFIQQMKEQGGGEDLPALEKQFDETMGQFIEKSNGQPKANELKDIQKQIQEKSESMIKSRIEDKIRNQAGQNNNASGQAPNIPEGAPGNIQEKINEQIQRNIPQNIQQQNTSPEKNQQIPNAPNIPQPANQAKEPIVQQQTMQQPTQEQVKPQIQQQIQQQVQQQVQQQIQQQAPPNIAPQSAPVIPR